MKTKQEVLHQIYDLVEENINIKIKDYGNKNNYNSQGISRIKIN